MRKYKKKYHIHVSISFMEEFNYINILSKYQDIVITRVCTILSQRKDLERHFIYNKKLIHFFYSRADQVVVLTKYAKKEMISKYGIPEKKITIIPNSIFEPDEKICKNDKWIYGNSVVLCVGRLEDVKQQNIAIRAFVKVAEQIPDAKLLILGKGPNYEKLKKLISKYNLEDIVYLLGFQKDTMYFMKNSNIYLMTSKTEGFSNSTIEAMGMGLPVISTYNPAVSEILSPSHIVNKRKINYMEYGVITPYINHDYLWEKDVMNEEKLLSDVILKMLTDNEMRQNYSKQSLLRAETFKTDKIMKKWNRLMNQMKKERYGK